jgi:DNA-binding NarL/FixJ family response regulator
MDISLEGMDGIQATRQIRSNAEGTVPVLMLTMHDDQETITAALTAGAAGYLPKNVARDELVAAIRAVSEGQGVLHPSVTRPFLDRIVATGTGAPQADVITARELDVLALLADGKSTKQIADVLIVSDETVKTHLKHLYQKLGVRDRAQAVATAFRRGLVQ